MSIFGKSLMPVVVVSVITWIGCVGFVPGLDEVTVTTAGGGIGVVTSTPNGINCSSLGTGSCQSQFTNAPTVTLTETPSQGFTFGGWQGCNTETATTCTVSAAANVTATFTATLNNINHIIFIAQENRSFDNYFGAMREYWAQNNTPDQELDGLPQFNPPANPALAPTNPGCDPAFPDPPTTNTFCQIDANSPNVQSFHAQSLCVENPSPSWAEAHRSWNVHDPTSPTPLLNGFVDAGANDARQHTVADANGQPVLAPFFDTNGVRVMGYYDATDLNYYYALATAFSTSDRWFAPVMTRTPPNREYLIAGTSYGYVYQRGTTPADTALIPSKTIFEALQNAGISWKIYVNGGGATPCTDTDIQCLLRRSYIHDFVFGDTIKNNIGEYTGNPMHSIAPISEFYTDAVNGTLPQVAQIEPASDLGQDEHPEDNDPQPGQPACCTIQAGAEYVSSLINAVMCGQNNSPPSGTCTPGKSWQDSAFIFTFDEPGGFFDHVAPQATVNPDGILPVDLQPNDPCFGATAPHTVCDFSYTGYRVPLVVVSPYAKKNFVSHQTRDLTAIIKLIERRFNLHTLTERDKAQVDMDDATTGFFDFNTAPWRTPPILPAQTVLPQSACFVDPPPTSP
ncbi:MAG: alkaline phosphatase family protein [Terriglobales bacterium]